MRVSSSYMQFALRIDSKPKKLFGMVYSKIKKCYSGGI